jgi:hypothetical protein
MESRPHRQRPGNLLPAARQAKETDKIIRRSTGRHFAGINATAAPGTRHFVLFTFSR